MESQNITENTSQNDSVSIKNPETTNSTIFQSETIKNSTNNENNEKIKEIEKEETITKETEEEKEKVETEKTKLNQPPNPETKEEEETTKLNRENGEEEKLDKEKEETNDKQEPETKEEEFKTPKGFEPKKLFIGGIDRAVDDHGLHDFFSKYGNIIEAIIMRDPYSQISRGFGFVEFDNEKSCETILEGALSIRKIMNGRSIEIKRARARSESNNDYNNQMNENSNRNIYARKIYIRALPTINRNENPEKAISEEQTRREEMKTTLKEYFTQFGNAHEINVDVFRGFAFITFDDKSEAQSAINHPKHFLFDKQIEVYAAKPKVQPNYYYGHNPSEYMQNYGGHGSYYDAMNSRGGYYGGYGGPPMPMYSAGGGYGPPQGSGGYYGRYAPY